MPTSDDLPALSDADLIAAYCAAMPEGHSTPESEVIVKEMERRDLEF